MFFCNRLVFAQEETGVGTGQSMPIQQQPFIPLEYRFPKPSLNPYEFQPPGGGLFLKPPSNLETEIVFDPVTNRYVFKEKIGNTGLGAPYAMDMPDFLKYNLTQQKKLNWENNTKQSRTGGVSGSTGFMPQFSLGGETFDRIFGTNVINIVPQGSAELIFGLRTTRTENPNLSESARKNTTFNFDTKLQVNVAGSIGDKMKMGINYNTEAMFDFENQAKLVYEGKEDEIIQKIEAGNVTMPLPGSLITVSQSLFGLKTELQFGKLSVTAVASQQKGQTQSMEIRGGSQINEFNLRGDEYDANKHFFLAQYFRDQYEQAHQTVPIITSGVTITKIEVWVTNKSNNMNGRRNLVAFMDLGEMNDHIYNDKNNAGYNPQPVPQNDSIGIYNTLYGRVRNVVRDFSSGINGQLTSMGLTAGIDFEKLEAARLLTDREFSFHPTLGYISLNTALNADEVLGVAYEYTYRGRTYQVGELSRGGVLGEKGIVVKMLKGTKLVPRYPTWKLMMKNIYSIYAFNIEKKDFYMDVLYSDDRTGNQINYIPEDAVSKDILLNIMGLDRVNSQNDAFPDGVFDFIENVTINSSNGKIIIPVLEPFGGNLRKFLKSKNLSEETINKYVYQALYDSTLTKAKELAEFNKFVMHGRYSSEGGSEIMLNAMNIPEGSVVVTAGGVKLVENMDYTVDYNMGRVKIINSGLLESGTPIKVSVESNALFAIQQKTMVGTHLNYKFSDNFNLGATVLRLTERPLTQKVNIGDEPLANTMLGFNMNYNTELPFLTTLVDKLPLIQTKAPSSLDFTGEFAQLIPGQSKSLMKQGSAYIDDFEASKSSYDLRSQHTWRLASIPQNSRLKFPESELNDDLNIGKNRARLAWYVIDPLFINKQYMNSQVTPDYMRNNPDRWTSSNFVRTIYEEELFPNREHQTGVPTNIAVLNVAYYPSERGPYNYDAYPTSYSKGVNNAGKLLEPRSRWGGMMREVNPNDFEGNNIQYIEGWVMDPFVEGMENGGGVDLYFHLGDISEDILKDGRKSAEQGLPVDGDLSKVDSTAWGYVPKVAPIVHSFDNTDRTNQDVGFDGMSSERERRFFEPFLNDLANIVPVGSKAFEDAWNDPSTDDFVYSRNARWDAMQADILTRYKYFNGTEGNSSSNEQNSTLPDEEDINRDNTMSETESYFQYKLSIRKGDLQVGRNFIVDKREGEGTTGKGDYEVKKADWYQFRIPISEFEQAVGGIQDFKTIRFMRMFLTNCPDSIILRFARLELVRSEWRQYNQSFQPPMAGTTDPQSTQAIFENASVNIEENAGKTPIPYMVPPGFDRAVDQASREMQQLNEQSMLLRVKDLSNGDARAVYKNVNYDMRRYKSLEMEVHAEEIDGYPLRDDEMSLFLRIGTDYRNNFYEYEIPLKLTPWGMGIYRDIDVWLEANRIQIDLTLLPHIKQERDDRMRQTGASNMFTTPFPYDDGDGRTYYVCGNPNLANVRVVMIGIRYPQNEEFLYKSTGLEVWVNELRLSNASKKGGWAANARLAVRVADFATFAISGESIQPGFGGVDSKINGRSTEIRNSYDLSASFELGKLLPEDLRVQIPLYVGRAESFVTPEFDPTNPDVTMKDALNALPDKHARDSLKALGQDYTRRNSINFTNVRVNTQHDKPRFWHLSNFTLNYAYYETYRRNVTTEKELEKNYTGGIIYDYSTIPLNITPFQKVKFLNKPVFLIIRDFNFNLKPNRISLRTDMARSYMEITRRNINNPNMKQDAQVNKNWLWGRNFDLQWDLARSLKFDINAGNNARIDEPIGVVDRHMKNEYELWRDSVWTNIKNGGRITDYHHSIKASYTIPINKLPLLKWTSATASYQGDYMWNVAPIYAPIITDTDTTIFNPGNTINNRNTINLGGSLNFTTLYNKVPYFRNLSQPQRNQQQPQVEYKTVTYERGAINIDAGVPRSVTHNLNTRVVEVKLTDAEGKTVEANVQIVNENSVRITTAIDLRRASVTVKGSIEKRVTNPSEFIARNLTRVLLGVKNLSVNYTQNGGTILPGYAMNSNMFGVSGSAPGLPFLLGWQDNKFPEKAIANNWLVQESQLNAAVAMTHTNSLSARLVFEPFQGMRVNFSAMRSFTENRTSYYIWDPTANNGAGGYPQNLRSPLTSGSYSISVIALRSSFEKHDPKNNYRSAVFDKFTENRSTVSSRRASELQKNNASYAPTPIADGGFDGYSLEAQEVMIPSFYAAYMGRNPEKVSLNDFPSFLYMLPNWDLDFSGLSNIPLIKKYFRSVSIRHTYAAKYSVGSYTTNQAFNADVAFGSGYTTNQAFNADVATAASIARDLQNNFIPRNDIATASLDERFNPLIGIDMTFLNSLTTRIQINKSRVVALGLGNLQMSENNSSDIVVGLGYVFNQVPLTIKTLDGDTKRLQSDLKVNADFKLSDNKTLIRRIGAIDETTQEQNILPVQASAGNKQMTLNLKASYNLSSNFTLSIYFDRIINTPFVSTSYKSYNTNFGFSMRFMLVQ